MAETVKSCFFSVIMPVFNAEKWIARAITSVQQQSFTDWELIIINDGSTDGTSGVIKQYEAEDERIYIIEQLNKKQGAARNAGMKVAKGIWVAFLDADDEWLPQKLAYQYQVIQENPTCHVISTSGYTRFSQEPVNTHYHFALKPGFFEGKEMYALEMFHNYLPVLSLVLERIWIDKVGLFDESSDVQGCEDHDYWLRLAKAGAIFLNSPERTFVYHIHSENTSNQPEKQSFSSANIRLKNFDRALLTQEQIQDFAKEMNNTIAFLREKQMAHHADELAVKLQNLSITGGRSDPGFTTAGRSVKRILKRLLMGILKAFVFPLKKRSEKYNRRIAAEYQKWLYHAHLKVKGPVKISPKAKMEFLHEQAQITTYGLQIGDYSYLNLTTANSELVTGSNFLVNKFCNFNILGKVWVGSDVLFNNYCTLHCFEAIEIGDNSWFGEGVKFYDHNHRFKAPNIPFTAQGYTTGKIKIGNNVWIGSNTVILQNVTIGDNCVIGANNIIYQSLPPNTLMKSGQAELIDRVL
jgi:glycosyltransferase involved in cell wall biosynthesis/carbonic anhydrase/acetyltransferase-like protein (isoleucine patch superfamily)